MKCATEQPVARCFVCNKACPIGLRLLVSLPSSRVQGGPVPSEGAGTQQLASRTGFWSKCPVCPVGGPVASDRTMVSGRNSSDVFGRPGGLGAGQGNAGGMGEGIVTPDGPDPQRSVAGSQKELGELGK